MRVAHGPLAKKHTAGMETVVGVPVTQAYLPTVSTTTQQTFLRRCSRGPQNSRIFGGRPLTLTHPNP